MSDRRKMTQEQDDAVTWAEVCAWNAGSASVSRLAGTDVLAMVAMIRDAYTTEGADDE